MLKKSQINEYIDLQFLLNVVKLKVALVYNDSTQPIMLISRFIRAQDWFEKAGEKPSQDWMPFKMVI